MTLIMKEYGCLHLLGILQNVFKMKIQKRPFGFHLMWGPVLLPGASGGFFMVLADVYNLSLGALSDQVSAHARNIFKTVAWRHRNG